MTTLSKNFEPQQVEEKWYRHWLSKNYFNSTPDHRKPYTIVIPPPNVTGVLHMGHTLNETVQDVLIRKARMSGFNACWVPGSDHASIATEAKVVQLLEKEKGIKKQDLSREEFLKHAFEWKEKYGGIIYHQIKKLGCSVDWNRVNFTMDGHYYKAVIKVFADLYKKGLIYRGARMINWDPQAKTALSDEEVEYRDIQGKLYYVRYLIADDAEQFTSSQVNEFTSSEGAFQSAGSSATNHSPLTTHYLVIATQRPETIMGDTAICVNPNDERYQHLKGKKVIVPLVNRPVPVIFDEYVDPAFGTGALKVTPAHDINDYNLGLKHNLPAIDTLNDDGTLSEAAQVFVGLDRFEARKKAIEQLRQEGLLEKEEAYQTRLGFSQRTHAVVEPRISTQWFVAMRELADEALNAVVSGDVQIHPEERFLNTYKHWLENVKDWCISRQLWWGQRIPAWYDKAGNVYVAEDLEGAKQLAYKDQGHFYEKKEGSDIELHQDEDVLDTWFSSWLWPVEVFHGITDPGNRDINYYYPTTVLVTGQDIIFFWVARMIMAGMEYRNEKPFEHVYFTGMVRDKQGRKMSKSLGNSPDLLELIDRFGADAVRFGILISAPAGNDLLFDDSSCEQGKFFNNKLWNALKLVKMWEERQWAMGNGQWAIGNEQTLTTHHSPLTFPVQWFESRLNQVKGQVEEMYRQFRLSEALKSIYSLIWDDFCSWYLEWMKPSADTVISAEEYRKTIGFFGQLMQLLHPFMPFVTEEIYHQLQQRAEGDDLCIKQFGTIFNADQLALERGVFLQQLITGLRNFRIQNNYKSHEILEVFVFADLDEQSFINPLIKIVESQTKTKLNLVSGLELGNSYLRMIINKIEFYVEKRMDNEVYRQKLMKELDYQKSFLASVEKKLGNERFVQNARPEVVEVEKRKKADAEQKIRAIEESLAGLG